MPTIPADQLTKFACRVLRAAGVPRAEAAIVGRSLVMSDLCGHDSHGILRLPSYVEKVVKKEVVPHAPLTIVKQSPTLVMADGNWGFGQVQMHRLIARTSKKAARQGMAVGTLIHVTHVGRLGEFSEVAAAKGLVSIIMANAHSSRRVAPPGGKTPRIGTNPIAFGVAQPTSIDTGGATAGSSSSAANTVGQANRGTRQIRSGGALVLDFSTAAAAEGKIRHRKIAGLPCPDGWLQDNQGRPTNDPESLYTNPPGAILPLGATQAYKGFGLALMIEIFAGALSGGPCIREKPNVPLGNGIFMLLLNPAAFGSLERFQAEVAGLAQYMRNSPTVEGVDEILLPGDPERRLREQRGQEGIPLEERDWRALVELADDLGVSVPTGNKRGKPRALVSSPLVP